MDNVQNLDGVPVNALRGLLLTDQQLTDRERRPRRSKAPDHVVSREREREVARASIKASKIKDEPQSGRSYFLSE